MCHLLLLAHLLAQLEREVELRHLRGRVRARVGVRIRVRARARAGARVRVRVRVRRGETLYACMLPSPSP